MRYGYKMNEILISDNYAVLVCTSKKYGSAETLIDIDDIERVQRYYWYIRYDKRHPKNYVESKTTGKRVHLHRFLLGLNEKFSTLRVVDHINGDSLDNRKNNLRICTQKENTQNNKLSLRSTSKIKYITWCKTHKRWKVIYKTKYHGAFKNLEDAKKRLEEIKNVKMFTA